jgi:hypothetical protein
MAPAMESGRALECGASPSEWGETARREPGLPVAIAELAGKEMLLRPYGAAVRRRPLQEAARRARQLRALMRKLAVEGTALSAALRYALRFRKNWA